jgi:predicted ATP-grasp superfamily ATP-dependent carboligase
MAERVLLVGDEYYASLAAVRALRSGGYEPWLAVSKPHTYAERSRRTAGTVLVPAPDEGPERLVEAVAREARRLDVAAVLPGMEPALLALAGRGELFPEGMAVGICPPETVARATDKTALPELAETAGLDTPPTVVFSSEDIGAVRDRLVFPAMVKPARSTQFAGEQTKVMPRGLDRRVGSYEELVEALADAPSGSWVAQPFLSGDLEAVSGVAWKGEVVCSVRQRAVRVFPLDHGVSAYAETLPPDAELSAAVARLIGHLGWSGIFETQYLRSGGTPFLIDLNPRVYGSIGLAIHAGANLPAIWTDLLLGRTPDVNGYAVGVRFRAEHRDLLTLAQLVRRGRFREAVSGLIPRPRTTHAIFSLRDPAPALGLVAALRRRIRE